MITQFSHFRLTLLRNLVPLINICTKRGSTNLNDADNQSLTTNGEIYNYEVMEAFIVSV